MLPSSRLQRDVEGREPAPDPSARSNYDDEIARRVGERVPVAIALFTLAVVLSVLFEVLRFPSHNSWNLAFGGGFLGLGTATLLLAKRHPSRVVATLVVWAILVGAGVNGYHVIVRASLPHCITLLTALLGASALIFPWGPRAQALASIGALAGFPLHLVFPTADVLTWAAGFTYLSMAAVVLTSGAWLFARDLRRDLVHVAQLEAARAEAVRANVAKDTFIAMVSHELRTPLSPLLMWSNMLRRGRLDESKAKTALEKIERSARTQARLIEDLVDVSRISSGSWHIELQPVELGAAVRNAIEEARPLAEEAGIDIHGTLPALSIPVEGDEPRLQQIASNLIGNALKFTPSGGRIDVILEASDGLARLHVRDSGDGIPAEFLPHLFEPFRQGETSSARRRRGLGLGLAIVRALVEQHGGRIRAESAGLGMGSTFTVELPLLVTEAPAAIAATAG